MKKIIILTAVLASIFGCSSEIYVNDDPIILWADTVTVKNTFKDTLVFNANRLFQIQSVTDLHTKVSTESNITYDTVKTYDALLSGQYVADLKFQATYKDPNQLQVVLTANDDKDPYNNNKNRDRLHKINVTFEDSWGYIIIKQESAPNPQIEPES